MDGGEAVASGRGDDEAAGRADEATPSFDGRLAALVDALRAVGRRWALALWSFTGVGSPDGPWLMPILYVGPPLLGRALWRLARQAPRRARRLLLACVGLVGAGWLLGLWGSLDGGPFSLGVRSAQLCGTVGLSTFCGALASWTAAAGMAAVAPLWRKGARQGALALALGAALAVEDAVRGDGALTRPTAPTALDGPGWVLVGLLVLTVVGTLISATLAVRATRASLDALRRSLPEAA